MATNYLNLKLNAMNKKSIMKHENHFHIDGMEIITYLLAAVTVFIISYSIYTAF